MALFSTVIGAACSEDGTTQPANDAAAPPDEYTHFKTPVQQIESGTSGFWITFVAGPEDAARDVLDITGLQTAGGHHATLYGYQGPGEPIGTTRVWTNQDQLGAHWLGAIGLESTAAVKPPTGTVFRLPAGYSLAIQTHYYNTSDAPIQVSSAIDVRFAPASPERVVASMLTFSAAQIAVEPGVGTTLEMSCIVPEDFKILMWANHMHEYGKSVITTATDGAGVVTDLKADPIWEPEWSMHANWDYRPLADPLVIHAGTTIKTTCSWVPDVPSTLHFPDEMCVLATFYVGDQDKACVSGTWR